MTRPKYDDKLLYESIPTRPSRPGVYPKIDVDPLRTLMREARPANPDMGKPDNSDGPTAWLMRREAALRRTPDEIVEAQRLLWELAAAADEITSRSTDVAAS